MFMFFFPCLQLAEYSPSSLGSGNKVHSVGSIIEQMAFALIKCLCSAWVFNHPQKPFIASYTPLL